MGVSHQSRSAHDEKNSLSMKTVHPDNCIFKYCALEKSLQCNVNNNIGKTSFDFPRLLITTLKTFPIRLDTLARRLLVFVNFRVHGTLPVPWVPETFLARFPVSVKSL